MSDLADTRLPPGTTFDSEDWFEVLTAVFDRLDAHAEVHPWASTEDEHRAMTRGQRAVFNLQWLTEADAERLLGAAMRDSGALVWQMGPDGAGIDFMLLGATLVNGRITEADVYQG